MMNSTPEERGCQAPAGDKVAALKQGMEAGLTTSDLNAVISEISGKPRLQDTTPKPLPPSDPNSVEANFPNWAKDPFMTKATPIGKVIEACNQSSETPAKKKSIEESKKLIENFKEKLGAYPKYLSYEGSVVLCVMVSINETNGISLAGLPQVDRDLIISQLPSDAVSKMSKGETSLSVEFDDIRDFVMIYKGQATTPIKLNFFNAVIHPQKLPDTNVPVEKDGDSVKVGSALILDRKRIERLVGNAPPERAHKEEENDFPIRQPVSGRNAYEIRADVLQMAMDWARQHDPYNKKDENDVLQLAKKFYSFVEDRRR